MKFFKAVKIMIKDEHNEAILDKKCLKESVLHVAIIYTCYNIIDLAKK